MSRSMTTVALLASTLLVLPVADARADVTLDAAPPMELSVNLPSGAPGVITVMEAFDLVEYVYTVRDKDTWTPSLPPPPPPPFDPVAIHDDKVRIVNFCVAGDTPWFWATVGPFPGDWAVVNDYTTCVQSFNDSGDQKIARISLFFDDAAERPEFVPPQQVHGDSDDTQRWFEKTYHISP